MESRGVLAQHLRRVARRIERDEHRLDAFGLRAEYLQRRADGDQIGRTDIRALRVAEVEQHEPSAELFQLPQPAAAIGKGKWRADRRLPGHQLVHEPRRLCAPFLGVRGERDEQQCGRYAPNVNSVPVVDGRYWSGIMRRKASAMFGPLQWSGMITSGPRLF